MQGCYTGVALGFGKQPFTRYATHTGPSTDRACVWFCRGHYRPLCRSVRPSPPGSTSTVRAWQTRSCTSCSSTSKTSSRSTSLSVHTYLLGSSKKLFAMVRWQRSNARWRRELTLFWPCRQINGKRPCDLCRQQCGGSLKPCVIFED